MTRPPLLWLLLSLVTALIGLAGSIIFAPSGPPAIFTWFLSGPISFLLIVVFTVIDNSRRTSLFYSVNSFAVALYWITLALALAGVILSAWHLADWIGRI